MEYVWFSVRFTMLHAVAYTLAGALILRVSKSIYEGKSRLMSYVRDMSDASERNHLQRWFFPAQLVRGLLLSVVLYPVLGPIGEIGFGLRFAFLGGLMFFYTHIACAAPCSDNIEGLVYMKARYFDTAFGFERHAIGGLQKMSLMVTISLSLMLTVAVGRTAEKRPELIRCRARTG